MPLPPCPRCAGPAHWDTDIEPCVPTPEYKLQRLTQVARDLHIGYFCGPAQQLADSEPEFSSLIDQLAEVLAEVDHA